LGLVCEKERDDLGQVAAMLLRTLEYRGYDSTGAAIQRDDGTIDLRKGVGAPSQMVQKLGITSQKGRVFCGQVRWATFGAVTEENAQPHEVRCASAGVHIYGAHNGNVTNCDALKAWLESEGHSVRSDNDGEMVVHTIEHEFGREIGLLAEQAKTDPAERRAAMRCAIVAAARRLEGSFAAVVVDPLTRVACAIKQGSSLYFGIGRGEVGGAFGLASSDLSSVLKMTRMLVPLREGEFVEFDASGHHVYSIATGAEIARAPTRSKLRVEDTALDPRFASFMEQEIAAQPRTVRTMVDLFAGGGAAAQLAGRALHAIGEAAANRMRAAFESLRDEPTRERLSALVESPDAVALLDRVSAAGLDAKAPFVSSDAALLAELLPSARSENERILVRLADATLERDEAQEFQRAVDGFADLVAETVERRGRVLVLSCGSSYNAACTGALFWNEIAGVELVPLLPGQFRERVSRTLRSGDLVVTISQSGETKDLVDVLDDIIASGLDVRRLAIVNNVNSTIPLEKSDLVVPLRCGPEIAVPATKSFMAQLVLLYGVALRVAEEHGGPAETAAVGKHRAALESLPALLETTSHDTAASLDQAAKLLFQRPSLHLLATRLSGLAREGALKIREVVLDHAEGFEASEFKHGPNTLLGFNTLFGPDQLADLFERVAKSRIDTSTQARAFQDGSACGLDGAALVEALRRDYPLVFLTGPDARDVALTISQLNTHKIRGAMPIVIAEEDASLRRAAEKRPVDNPNYRFVYVSLPSTGNTLATAFSATIALQRLALRMSSLKSMYLDGLGIPDHGVHPDVPKNVSKSITVD
jgi:glucosamine 6-phosphate synthetase-like amidotransferase/phosphosugar isomerase protein